MGFFSSLKRAFGLGSSEDDYDTDAFGVDATVTPMTRQDDSAQHQEEQMGASVTENTPDLPPVPLDSIFNTVVEIFNQAMPSFLGDSANPDIQREKLYNALDGDVKKYMDAVRARADEECELKWRSMRLSLEQEVDALNEKLSSMEETGSEKGKELLSAQRQKRAMNERIRDLEAQINQLEAEKEQYELENRSLVNKLRVSNVVNDTDSNVADYESRILDLQDQLTALNDKGSTLTCENARLSEENVHLTEDNTRLATENREANNKITELNEQVEALRIKTDMTDVMLNDLNNRAASSHQEVSDRESRIETLEQELEDAKNAHQVTIAELEEANANLEIAAQIHAEIEKIHELLTRKNAQIAELTGELKHRDERINALEAEETSLRRTIESNLMDRANMEQSLKEEIESLKQQYETQSRDKRNSRKRVMPHISAIDDDLDNTDWLVATPPEGKNARTSGVSDSEFGYQAPDRKNPPENSAQMSLW